MNKEYKQYFNDLSNGPMNEALTDISDMLLRKTKLIKAGLPSPLQDLQYILPLT